MVRVCDRDTVVIIEVDEFDRLHVPAETSLHELLSRSLLNRLDFGGRSIQSWFVIRKMFCV